MTPEFLGAFHPLLVHLPIGILFVLAVTEVLGRIPSLRHLHDGRGVLVTLAALAAVGGAVTGWMLAGSGGYDDALLRWHRWSGFAVAAGSVLMWVWYARGQDQAYALTFLLTVGLVMVAGHHGGSLTHGRDHLTRHAPAPIRSWLGLEKTEEVEVAAPVDPAETRLYADIVHPVLKAKCIACHGPEKQKGGLRLDSLEGVLQGGESGPVVNAGRGMESPLVALMRLPPGHDDHMPPDGKPQPSPEDMDLVEWWIDEGASPELVLGDLDVPAAMAPILENLLGLSTPGLEPLPLHRVLPVAHSLEEELGTQILPVVEGEPWLRCEVTGDLENFGDAELARLQPLAANLQQLDLGGTSVTDAGMHLVGAMDNLTRLHLEKTGVTDAGISSLTGLGRLAYLNLYGTAVSDECLADLRQLPSLRKVFVWQTAVSADAAATYAARMNTPRVAKWTREITELQDQMRAETLDVVLGE